MCESSFTFKESESIISDPKQENPTPVLFPIGQKGQQQEVTSKKHYGVMLFSSFLKTNSVPFYRHPKSFFRIELETSKSRTQRNNFQGWATTP